MFCLAATGAVMVGKPQQRLQQNWRRCTAHGCHSAFFLASSLLSSCRLRDELMDDVADALDDLKDPEARLALSYGELLSQAIQQRQLAADAQAVAEVAAESQPAAAAAAAAAAAEDAGALTTEAAMESILAALPEPAVLVPLPAAVPAVAVQRQEQEEVDDFLASVLASPSPQDAAQLPAVPEGPAVATAAAALGAAAAPEAAAAAEPATEPAAAAGAGVGAENSAASAEREGSGSPPPEPVLPMTAEQRRLLHWHWANLEYGCSARLEEVRHAVLRMLCYAPCFRPASCCSQPQQRHSPPTLLILSHN